uniref:Large ribosomal subunit protein bL12c n=1 Tax=Lepocinclis steinii TaxID=459226 RepID=A0A3G3LLP5_9EUGL|nr:ribosomal protein L12 [Lepocinclis steinii]AYQ93629.1 ribosomal protein L12 [Lepocinclis steinii]
MSSKVEKIIEDLKSISLLEASELIVKIEQTFGVDASVSRVAAVVDSGASTSRTAKAEEKAVEEKTEFNLIIKDVPTAKRITVIKVVRSLTSLGLKEAKDLIESVPKQVLENISKEKAEESKKLLEEAGAVVVIE